MKIDKDFIKFKWETNEEHEYRYQIHLIATDTAIYFKKAENIANEKRPNYRPIYNGFLAMYDKLKTLKPSWKYEDSHNFVITGYEYYKKSYELLLNELTKQNINKSVSYIEIGICYTKIAAFKNFEMHECMNENCKDDKN